MLTAVARRVETLRQPAADLPALFEAVAAGAVDLVPGADGAVVVTSARADRVPTQSASGELAAAVLTLQSETVGPFLDAAAADEPIVLLDLATERRWPEFTSAALALGVRSMMCLPLTVNGQVLGSVWLISKMPDAFDENAERMSRVYTTHAAIAVLDALVQWDLRQALASRDVIGQAKGILMERFAVGPDVAFATLVRASQVSNRKLRDICRELCDTGRLGWPARGTDPSRH
jgi:GAF domain-containing protein